MNGAFFGELYLRSTLPFLSDDVTAREVEFLRGHFSKEAPSGPLLDLGCGHGRHAAALAQALGRPVFGVELDALSLSMRKDAFPAVRADFRSLPLGTSSASGAYAWYSTLFVFQGTDVHRAVLAEIARTLKPSARLYIHSAPFERLESNPRAEFRTTLPDGSTVEEHSEFDARSGLDRGHRTLRLPDGRVLSAGYTVQYYRLPELQNLLTTAGLRLISTWGGLYGEPLSPSSTDLIVGAARNDA